MILFLSIIIIIMQGTNLNIFPLVTNWAP